MKREIDNYFHENMKGMVIDSLSYTRVGGGQVTYVTIRFKDGSRLGIGLDCTLDEHSMGFSVDSSKQKGIDYIIPRKDFERLLEEHRNKKKS